MSQSTFTNTLTAYQEGQIAQGRLSADVQSKIVDETNGIEPGRICVLSDSAGKLVRKPYSNQAVITFSTALVSGDVVGVTVYINGSANVLTSTTYATSAAATYGVIETKLEAVTGVASATVSGNTITVVASAETDLYITTSITNGGAGTATISNANTESGTFFGPALLSELQPETTGATTVTFADETAVGIGRKCYFVCRTDDTIVPGSALAVRFYQESAADKKRGMVLLASGVGTSPVLGKAWTALNVEVGASAGGLAVLSLNLP